MKRSIKAAVVLLLVLSAGACSEDRTGVTAAGADSSNRAPGDPHGPAVIPSPESEGYENDIADPKYPVSKGGDVIADWSPAPNFPAFVEWSDAAIIGRVTTVGEGRWNTPDNSPAKVDPAQPHKPLPWKFRDAAVVVEEVLYGSTKLPVAAGQTLTVRLMGDGTDTGVELEGADPVHRANALSGSVAQGDRVVWVLTATEFRFTDGRSEQAIRLVTDFYGAWKVNGSNAENREPRRTVPVQALAGKLRAERATPSKLPPQAQSRGKVNPLE